MENRLKIILIIGLLFTVAAVTFTFFINQNSETGTSVQTEDSDDSFPIAVFIAIFAGVAGSLGGTYAGMQNPELEKYHKLFKVALILGVLALLIFVFAYILGI